MIFFLFTGKFKIIFEKYKAFMGQDRGKIATNIIANDILTNKPIDLEKLKGKVVLLNFWATWCPPCKFEIPSFIDLYKNYNNQGLEIIGISVDSEGAEKVKSFINSEKINYPVIMYNYQKMKDFGDIVAVPTSILINKEGKIQDIYPGFYTKWTFEKDIKKLLEK
ncbi:MAG: TlpA disulfide reductase family protein [Candidatus Sericytochromatia bacterium]